MSDEPESVAEVVGGGMMVVGLLIVMWYVFEWVFNLYGWPGVGVGFIIVGFVIGMIAQGKEDDKVPYNGY